jgi:hypothetical protein
MSVTITHVSHGECIEGGLIETGIDRGRYQYVERPRKERDMKKMTVIAAAILLASSAAGYAAPKGGNAGGASELSPGDQLRDSGGPKPGSRGASEFAPGDLKKDSPRTVGRGASEFSPGDKVNDIRKKKH